jgi:hypothetical protein
MGMLEESSLRPDRKHKLIASMRLDIAELPDQFNGVSPA